MYEGPEKFMPKFESVFEVQFEYLRIRTQTMKIAIFNDFNLVSSLSCLYVDGAQVFIPEIGLFSQGGPKSSADSAEIRPQIDIHGLWRF